MSDGAVLPSDEETLRRGQTTEDQIAAAGRWLEETDLPRASAIGRFRVLHPIGEGGMGSVYAAYDPELDRKIAVKVLRGGSSTDGTSRMLREAQALAQLTHPNVVAVHDVGIDGGRVFIAMEYLAGQTLGTWMKKNPPADAARFEQVADLLVQAGRGLAAAHDAEMIHRDFKPHNVICGDDGRVRVVDFGLARARRAQDTHEDDDAADATATMRLDDRLTATGAAVGTPAYMAPEQFAGEEVDARADVFGFCVTAWEAVFGGHPFLDNSSDNLLRAIARGRIEPPAGGLGVPAWVEPLLRRGLALRPADRPASMRELLGEMEAGLKAVDAQRPWWPALAVSAGIIAIGGAVTVFALQAGDEACRGSAEQLVEIWDDAVRTQTARAVLGTELPYAEATWPRLQEQLDDYASAWVAARTDACEATSVREEQTAAMMDMRIACLDASLRDLSALTSMLREADAQIVENAHKAIDALPRLERCADADYVMAQVKPPSTPALAATVARLQGRLALAATSLLAAKYDRAEAILDETKYEVEQADYAPLLASHAMARGTLARHRVKPDEARAALGEAYELARSANDPEVAASASIEMVILFAKAYEFDSARRWATLARIEVSESGDPTEAARLDGVLGMLYRFEGRFEDADAHYKAAITAYEEMGAKGTPAYADALVGSATCDARLGQAAKAIATYEEAIAQQAAELGPDHPRVASNVYGMGTLQWSTGDFEAAALSYARAREAAVRSFGEAHPDVARASSSLALMVERTDGFAAAEPRYREAIATYDSLPEEHPDIFHPLSNYGGTLARVARTREAIPLLERARRVAERTLAPDRPDWLTLYHNLAMAYGRDGRIDEAVATYEQAFEQALRFLERGLREGHSSVQFAGAVIELGRVEHGCTLLDTYRKRAVVIGASATGRPFTAFYAGVCLEHRGRLHQAWSQYLLSLAAIQKAGRPDLAELGLPAAGLSRVALASGALPQAVTWAEFAVEKLTGQDETLPRHRGDALLALARALERMGGQRERVVTKARAAAVEYDALGPAAAGLRAEALALASRRTR